MKNILKGADEAGQQTNKNALESNVQPWDTVEEMLTEARFKVLFSTTQERQNLKDYILKIYKTIVEGSKNKNTK